MFIHLYHLSNKGLFSKLKLFLWNKIFLLFFTKKYPLFTYLNNSKCQVLS